MPGQGHRDRTAFGHQKGAVSAAPSRNADKLLEANWKHFLRDDAFDKDDDEVSVALLDECTSSREAPHATSLRKPVGPRDLAYREKWMEKKLHAIARQLLELVYGSWAALVKQARRAKPKAAQASEDPDVEEISARVNPSGIQNVHWESSSFSWRVHYSEPQPRRRPLCGPLAQPSRKRLAAYPAARLSAQISVPGVSWLINYNCWEAVYFCSTGKRLSRRFMPRNMTVVEKERTRLLAVGQRQHWEQLYGRHSISMAAPAEPCELEWTGEDKAPQHKRGRTKPSSKPRARIGVRGEVADDTGDDDSEDESQSSVSSAPPPRTRTMVPHHHGL